MENYHDFENLLLSLLKDFFIDTEIKISGSDDNVKEKTCELKQEGKFFMFKPYEMYVHKIPFRFLYDKWDSVLRRV